MCASFLVIGDTKNKYLRFVLVWVKLLIIIINGAKMDDNITIRLNKRKPNRIHEIILPAYQNKNMDFHTLAGKKSEELQVSLTEL